MPGATSNFYLSLVAAATSIVLVLSEGHVHVDGMNPATWPQILAHKCGCVMVGCLCWALAEVMKAIFFPSSEEEVGWRMSRAFQGRVLR